MNKKKALSTRIKYAHDDQKALDQVEALWEGLNQYMGERSTYFKQHFAAMTFKKRKADLLKKTDSGIMRVDLAIDQLNGEVIAYLVSSVSSGKIGCVESVFVSAAYRGFGIGDKLMRTALAWMEEKGAVEKVVEVTVGNEQVYGFYGRYGFLPRQTLLKQVKKA